MTRAQTASPSARPSSSASATPLVVSPTATGPTISSVTTREIDGEISKISSDTITVKADDGTQQIPLSNSINIKRDGKSAGVTDLKPGDMVKVLVNSNTDEAISVEATSAAQTNLQQWLVPAIVGIAIVLALLLWLMRKAQTRHIKTSGGNM
jgi:hypothetical protein